MARKKKSKFPKLTIVMAVLMALITLLAILIPVLQGLNVF